MFSPGVEPLKKSENDLIVLACTNRMAFGELYQRHVDKVYTYVYYRTGSRAQTEDIVSATFLKALEHLDSFRPKNGGFTAWLLRIARNQLYDDYRKNRRQILGAPREDEADTTSPEDDVLRSELAAQIRDMVDKLPDTQREIILLKFSLDLKNTEIAQVIGKSETAVSSLLHRAMQTLRTEVNLSDL